MSLTWHLLKTDLRHTRWSLLAWTLAQALLTAASLSLWYTPKFLIEHPLIAQPSLGLATFALFFTAYDFAVRIIQADNPCVSSAFWRTRPINPARLLAAKLLTLLFCSLATALPAASIYLIHQLAAGVSFNLLPPLVVVLLQVPFVTVAVLFATLTPSSRHCLYATILGLIGFFLWAAVSLNERGDINPGLAQSRLYMTAALTAATIAFVITHQYRTARFRRSLIALGVGLTVALTTPYWWHRPTSYHETIATETESALTRDIALRSVHPQLQTENFRRRSLTYLSFDAESTPPPASYLLNLDSARQHWPAIDLTTELAQPSDRFLADQYARAAITGANIQGPHGFQVRNVLPRDAATRLQKTDAFRAFEAECTFTLSRPEIVCSIPLRDPGHSIVTHPLGRTRIVALAPTGNTFWISTLNNPRESPLRLGYRSNQPSAYLLRHSPSGEILSLTRTSTTSPLGVELTQFTINESLPRAHTTAWLEDCDLVEVTPRPVARFTRTFSSTNLLPP